jgi:C4-dicarboxylate-specific signal transduction histidine kinase
MATRVLIVEDDADTRNNLCDILQMDGYQTDIALTAAEAVERIDETSYDLIIIDWHLPDMTAGEVLPRLRSHAPDASILIATGSSDIQHAIHAMRLGASDYIVKPVCPDLLIGSMRRAKNLQTAQQRAIQSERLAAIGTAVAAVAHESRNALQRIRSRVDLIRLMHENDEELLDDLSGIEDASSQLQSHFEELREFSAPIVLRKTSCGLQNLIQRVWQHVQCSGAHPGSRLCVPDHDTQCMIDSTRIEQVMRNLFENAIAASESEARVEVEWAIREIDDDEALFITVRDKGPGFTEEQRFSAFEPFFTTKGHGTGLGLPICRRIVEAHGGSIFVEESNNSGGAITISLPGVYSQRNSPTRANVCV